MQRFIGGIIRPIYFPPSVPFLTRDHTDTGYFMHRSFYAEIRKLFDTRRKIRNAIKDRRNGNSISILKKKVQSIKLTIRINRNFRTKNLENKLLPTTNRLFLSIPFLEPDFEESKPSNRPFGLNFPRLTRFSVPNLRPASLSPARHPL